jgi:hypothetical protein
MRLQKLIEIIQNDIWKYLYVVRDVCKAILLVSGKDSKDVRKS